MRDPNAADLDAFPFLEGLMASLFKKPNGIYSLSFFASNRRPTRKQVSLRTKTKRTADMLQRRLEDAWTLGEYDP